MRERERETERERERERDRKTEQEEQRKSVYLLKYFHSNHWQRRGSRTFILFIF